MIEKLTRVRAVAVVGAATLRVHWRHRKQVEIIDLADWIASGGRKLSPLADPTTFNQVRIEDHGFELAWGNHDANLFLGASRLELLAENQKGWRPLKEIDFRRRAAQRASSRG